MFLSNEINVFCNAEDRFHDFSFLQEKVILELNCTKSTFIASKNTNSVFSAKYETARPRMLKNFFLSEKKLPNDFKSKAQT